jgi:uncharacterized membrane protein
MELLIVGIIIFFGIHLVPIFQLKEKLVQRLGKYPYMGLFSLIAALGLGLMIYGKGHAEFISVWQPMPWAHWVPIIAMWPALVLLVWAEIPCSMKITLRHPMLLGVLLFCISHLFANGDLATILLIGSFAVYAALTMLRQGFKKKESNIPNSTPKWNVFGLVVGTLAYGLIATFHQSFTGMPIPI